MNKQELERIITEAEEAYRNGDPIMDDAEFDGYVEQLKAIDPKHKLVQDAVTAHAPKTRKSALPIPMFSLNKVKTLDEIDKWLLSLGIAHDELVVITGKYDAISLCVNEEQGASWTRGDGFIGQESDKHFAMTGNVVKGIDFHTFGEAIISKENWKLHFEGKINPYNGKPYKVARNTVAGLFNRDIPAEELKYVDYMRYGIEEVLNLDKKSQLASVNSWNRVGVKYHVCKVSSLTEELLDALYYKWNEEYEIDGLVIDIDSLILRKKLGRESNNNPRYARALKLKHWSEEKDVTITGHKLNISKQGLLKGTVQFDPVIIGGSEVKQATFYNAGFLSDFRLVKGVKIKVKKSGDVIPKIVEVEGVRIPMKEDFKTQKLYDEAVEIACVKISERVNINKYEEFFDELVCPHCEEMLMWQGENFTEMVCENTECEGRKLSKIQHFFNVLDFDDFGDGEVENLFKDGFDSIEKILGLDFEKLQALDGWGYSSAKKIDKQLGDLWFKGVPMAKLLHALDVFNGKIGEKTCQLIFNSCTNEQGLPMRTEMDFLTTIDGVSTITANVFKKGLKTWENVYRHKLVGNTISITYYAEPKKEVTGDQFKGWKACFSGVRLKGEGLEKFTANGGEVVSGVSKNTTHLVLKDTASTSSKATKARDLGITIISLDELNTML